jgi:capsular exopolysaccharide synthesis family protein
VSQVTSDSFDALYNSGSGESRSPSRALVVRDHESQALSPYVMPGGMSPYGAEAAPAGLNLVQLLHALRRRWLLATIAGLMIGLPLAALVWLITPSNYEVIAWLKVGDDPAKKLTNNGIGYRDPGEYEQYRKTQAALIKSPDVLRSALNNPAIANLQLIASERDKEEFLKEEISVAFPLESEVLQIKMRGKDRSQLVKIVNAVKDSYLQNVVDLERQKIASELDLFDREVKQRTAEIADKREALKRLTQATNSSGSEATRAKQMLLMNFATSKLQQKSEADVALNRMRRKIKVLEGQNTDGDEPPEHLVEGALARYPTIEKLTQRIDDLSSYLEVQKRAVLHPESDPTVRQLDGEISGLKEQLDQAKARLRPQVVKLVKEELNRKVTPGDDPSTLAEWKANEQAQATLVEQLTEEYEEARQQAQTATSENAQVEVLENEIKRKEELVKHHEEKLSQLNLLMSMPNRVTPLMEASEPEAPNPMLRYFLTIFACLVGITVGAGGVVMMEYQARRVNNTTDLSIGAGLRVLGTVPNLSRLSTKGLNGSAALQGILAESVDSIRTMLLTREDPPHVVVVTSAGDSEGKTTVATHLAASLARSGRRTLLVDGDIRSPSIHAMFGVAPEPGVCEVIRAEADFEGVLQPTPVDGLMLVAAGQCDYQCIAALSKDNFKEFIEKAREQFEYVIIDAAPVLTYSDMLLMGAHVDASVLSGRRDVSQMHRVYEARERIESVGIRVLGAVVNGISETSRRPAYALPSNG